MLGKLTFFSFVACAILFAVIGILTIYKIFLMISVFIAIGAWLVKSLFNIKLSEKI
jgi:hypothetical protein